MSDAICTKCQEPWELYYLAHDALWEYPGDGAPRVFKDAHEEILRLDDEAWRNNDRSASAKPDHYKLGGKALQVAVMRGEGCPACWDDPSRVITDEDAQLDALRHNLFDSAWDGDPAELF